MDTRRTVPRVRRRRRNGNAALPFPTRSVGIAPRCRNAHMHTLAAAATPSTCQTVKFRWGFLDPARPAAGRVVSVGPRLGRRRVHGSGGGGGGGMQYSRRRPAGFGSLINGGSARRRPVPLRSAADRCSRRTVPPSYVCILCVCHGTARRRGSGNVCVRARA